MEMTKNNEKLMLSTLSESSSYFSDTFDKKTVKQMMNNIDNDFPILLNTGFVQFTKEEITFIKTAIRNYQNVFDGFPIIKENIDKLIKDILKKL